MHPVDLILGCSGVGARVETSNDVWKRIPPVTWSVDKTRFSNARAAARGGGDVPIRHVTCGRIPNPEFEWQYRTINNGTIKYTRC